MLLDMGGLDLTCCTSKIDLPRDSQDVLDMVLSRDSLVVSIPGMPCGNVKNELMQLCEQLQALHVQAIWPLVPRNRLSSTPVQNSECQVKAHPLE